MSAPFESLEATLQRLKREREEGDRLYNEAFTALDQALMRLPDFPHPPPPYDDHQITPLNAAWDIGVAAAAGQSGDKRRGLRGRLESFVWRLVGPPLQKQLTFNSLLVDHLNRNVTAHREAQRAIDSVIGMLRGQIADLLHFQSRLVVYLQQITLYVDSKDRETAGTALVVNAALNGMAEEFAKRWESLAAREERLNARMSSLTAEHEELRTVVSVSQQASLTVKREMERWVASTSTPDGTTPAVRQGSGGQPNATANSQAANSPRVNSQGVNSQSAFRPALDAYKYVGFEDQFRGSQATIRERLESYLPYFDGASDVLDVGCGRGEFLDLLNARGITARGLDLNHEMVEVCRARGLDVTEADVVGHLDSLPDGSLGGLFAAQVVEHLEPGYLLRFLELAFHKLRPNAPLVLETLNPACWTAFFDSFIRDITHVWPLHPETLRYLVIASGFASARIEYRSPVPPQDRLQPVARLRGDAASAGQAPTGGAAGPAARDDLAADFAETFNANVEKLNARMFTFLDYAIVGRR